MILAAMRRLAIAIVVAMTATAVAEPPDDTEASRIFLQGRELMKLGRFDEACELFTRSYGLDPGLGTAVNLADCLERQGQLRRAWALFDVVARNSQNNQSRASFARQRADALLARFGMVIVKLADPNTAGLAVRIGDRELTPSAEIRDLIEPGDVELVATAPGRPAWRTTLHAVAGTVVTAEIPAFAALREGSDGKTRRRRSRVYLADGLGAAGLLGLGTSLGFAISAKRTYDGAFDHECMRTPDGVVCTGNGAATIDRAGKRADLATWFAIGGALFVGAAVAVYFTAPPQALPGSIDSGPQRSKAQDRPAGRGPLAGTIRLAPVASDHALGLGVSGRF